MKKIISITLTVFVIYLFATKAIVIDFERSKNVTFTAIKKITAVFNNIASN